MRSRLVSAGRVLCIDSFEREAAARVFPALVGVRFGPEGVAPGDRSLDAAARRPTRYD